MSRSISRSVFWAVLTTRCLLQAAVSSLFLQSETQLLGLWGHKIQMKASFYFSVKISKNQKQWAKILIVWKSIFSSLICPKPLLLPTQAQLHLFTYTLNTSGHTRSLILLCTYEAFCENFYEYKYTTLCI